MISYKKTLPQQKENDMSTIIDLTEFGLTGICIDSKNISAVYDMKKGYGSLPRIHIHITDTDAILITSPFNNQADAIKTVHALRKSRDAAKINPLKLVK